MMEEMIDIILMEEAEKRIAEGGPTISFQDVLAENGITEADLEGWENVEID